MPSNDVSFIADLARRAANDAAQQIINRQAAYEEGFRDGYRAAERDAHADKPADGALVDVNAEDRALRSAILARLGRG